MDDRSDSRDDLAREPQTVRTSLSMRPEQNTNPAKEPPQSTENSVASGDGERSGEPVHPEFYPIPATSFSELAANSPQFPLVSQATSALSRDASSPLSGLTADHADFAGASRYRNATGSEFSASPGLQAPLVLPGQNRHGSAAHPSERVSAPRTWSSWLFRAAKLATLAVVAWFAFVFFLILAYRIFDPPISALMLQRKLTGESFAQTWVPIEAISPRLVRAVLISEDGRFCQHWGVDLEAIETAIAKSGDGTPRGASTISMQVAKNLFLWPSKSYVRKVLEVPLTMGIELLWPKKRIMEVYLNIAEWGPGVFGAEEAARHHFGKSALRLNDREAARLAVSLPNPIRRNAARPGPGTRRLAELNLNRTRGSPSALLGCVLDEYDAD